MQDLCEMEREGSGAEWGSRLARAQVVFKIVCLHCILHLFLVLYFCILYILYIHMVAIIFYFKHSIRMPTTVSCGRGIASSLTQVIAERRSEKYPKSGDTKYLSSSMDIFFWLVIMANGNIIFLFVKTSVLLGDNG